MQKESSGENWFVNLNDFIFYAMKKTKLNSTLNESVAALRLNKFYISIIWQNEHYHYLEELWQVWEQLHLLV